jgi:hypothetical protein
VRLSAKSVRRIRRNIRRNISTIWDAFSCIFVEAHTSRSAMQTDVQFIEKKGQCSQARESAGTCRNGRTAASGSAYLVRMSEGVRRSSTEFCRATGHPNITATNRAVTASAPLYLLLAAGQSQGRWSGASGAHSWPHRPLPNGGNAARHRPTKVCRKCDAQPPNCREICNIWHTFSCGQTPQRGQSGGHGLDRS